MLAYGQRRPIAGNAPRTRRRCVAASNSLSASDLEPAGLPQTPLPGAAPECMTMERTEAQA
jgi:hypothetical protein